MKIDKAREQTDKILKTMDRNIGRVYNTNPALLKSKKKLMNYLDKVKEQTKPEYDKYVNETDEKERKRLKKIYGDKVKELTFESKEYKKILKEFVETLSMTNQSALNIVNDSMINIYTLNYNQVGEECKRVGIKVE